MVDLLLEHGARTDLYGGFYDNPLLIAAYFGDIAIAQSLLKAGSDVNRKGGEMGTALNAACYCQSLELVQILLESGGDPNVQECFECDHALQTACERNNTDIALLLLEHGADPNLHGGWYGSALHAAFAKGNKVIVKALVAIGADIKYKGGEYWSTLHATIVSCDEAMVKLALSHGTSANEKGGWFTYPLMRALASESCPDSIARLLFNAGADPNLEREGDEFIQQTFRTTLQHAITPSKAALVLDFGADINAVSGWLGTALHTTMYLGGDERKPIMSLLIERGADVNRVGMDPPLCYAAREGQLDSAQLLVEAGADLNLVDMAGHSALHLALSNASTGVELCNYLLDAGADPLLVDRRGCSGLHYAARGSKLTALQSILKRAPDLDASDNLGWTPLHWAAASTRVSTQVVQALLSEGCNKDLRDKNGDTAQDLATKFNNTKIIALLNNHTKDTSIDPTETGFLDSDTEPCRYCDGCMIVRTLLSLPSLHSQLHSRQFTQNSANLI